MELDVRGRDHRGARRLQPPADPGNPGLRSDPAGAADGVPVGPGRRIRIPTVGIRTRITVIACAAFGVAVILGAVILGAVVLVWAVRDAVERSLDDRARAAADSVAAQATDGRLDVIATTVPAGSRPT